MVWLVVVAVLVALPMAAFLVWVHRVEKRAGKTQRKARWTDVFEIFRSIQ